MKNSFVKKLSNFRNKYHIKSIVENLLKKIILITYIVIIEDK